MYSESMWTRLRNRAMNDIMILLSFNGMFREHSDVVKSKAPK